jgi:hypothetical protein
MVRLPLAALTLQGQTGISADVESGPVGKSGASSAGAG